MRSGEQLHRHIASDMAAFHHQQQYHQQLKMINIPPHPPSYSEAGPGQYPSNLYNVDVKALADLPGHHQQQQQLKILNLPPHPPSYGDVMLESGPAQYPPNLYVKIGEGKSNYASHWGIILSVSVLAICLVVFLFIFVLPYYN